MTRKQKIAKFILDNPKATYSQWVEFQNSTPEIRLKKASKGKALINLEGKSGFTDPESWLNNYKAGQKINLVSALETSQGIFTKDELLEIISRFVSISSVDLEPKNESIQVPDRIITVVEQFLNPEVKMTMANRQYIAFFLYYGRTPRDNVELEKFVNR